MTKCQQITGLSDIAAHYDAFILDLWGVLHDGVRAYDHAVETLIALKQTGKPICLLSNVPRREAPTIERLNSLGLTPDLYDHLVTSGEATHQALKSPVDDWHRALGKQVYALSPREESEELTVDTPKILVDDPAKADFLLAIGIGHADETLADYRPALDVGLSRNLPLLCANPDLIVNAGGDRLAICAGSFAQYYADQGGNVAYHGKPHAPIYQTCRDRLGLDSNSRILAIGDSMATDVTGAKRAGLDACLVTSGIHLRDLADRAGDQAHSMRLISLIGRYEYAPTYAIPLCRWSDTDGA
jgi:HAD superfamily hydrolase (TIGR01459 family)